MAFPFPWRQRITEIARVRGITQVLVRNGLGFLVEQLGLDRWLPRLWRRQVGRADATVARLTIAERLRRTLEELGPTYIKLGQLLSGRGDLLPPDYIAELSKLLDAAPPVAAAQIRAVIEEELGAPVADLFATFDDKPIASASIGQVHRATLPDGQPVVVKVRRPGVEAAVEADLRLLLSQARFLARRSELVRSYNLVAIVEELARALREELDYKNEGRNAERLRSNLSRDTRAEIPAVYWNLTSRRVITLDYLDGVTLNEPERLRQARVDLPAAVRLTVEIYLTQIFSHGFYQADPHPANIMVMAGGGALRIGLVDFGNAGYLLPRQKELLGTMFLQLLDQDAAGLARTVVKMGAARGRPSLDALERDLQRLLIRYWGASLEQISIGEMLAEIFKVAYDNRVYLPGDLTLLGKTILTMEGTARSLDPDFVLADAVKPFAEQLVRERLSPIAAGRQALRAVRQAAEMAQAFPSRLDSLWDQLEEGDLTVGVDVRRLNVLLSRLNSMINRLAFALLVAALIVGSALILLGGKDSWELPILGVGIPVAQIVFLVAFGAAAWLIISMIRSRSV